MTAAAASAHAQVVLGRIDEILDLFSTSQYPVLNNLKYGLIMTAIGTLLLIIAGLTWFRVMGITPGWSG